MFCFFFFFFSRLRSAFNATQRTGIHKKECTKLSVNRQDKNKCTGNYCCRIEQCIRYSGLCLRRRCGCHGRRLFFFFSRKRLYYFGLL
uniref:Putative secreted protein n=1 Tax=Rhipicephalus microplus TaxID=6941 RepID=A0A6M2DD13_RHIMP